MLLAKLIGDLGLGEDKKERYLLRYLEGTEDIEFPAWQVWRQVADIRRSCDDVKGELDAHAQACTSVGTPTHVLSDSANRINAILSDITRNQTDQQHLTNEEKQFIVREVVNAIKDRFEDLDTEELSSATALSRLAWLQVHVDELASARATVTRGLRIDPNNTYCKNLARTLDESK